MCDLSADISPLVELDVQQLRTRLYTPKAELAGASPVPVNSFTLISALFLAPEKHCALKMRNEPVLTVTCVCAIWKLYARTLKFVIN